MSIDRNQANAAAVANLATKQNAANTVFITSVNTQIQTAYKIGRYSITAHAGKSVNISFLYLYFNSLGYVVSFPDYADQNAGVWPGLNNQPADLFGYYWVEYWTNQIQTYGVYAPTRITLSWNRGVIPPTPPFPPTGNFLLLENGFMFELEDDSGDILLES